MFNKVIMGGNLTRDIELKYSANGNAIANTAIATSRKFTVNGEKKEDVCFMDVTFYGRTAEVANQYLRKGSKVLLEGRIEFQQWVDKDTGTKRSKHVLIVETMQMLDSKPGAGSEEYSEDEAPAASAKPAPQAAASKPAPVRMPENNLPEIDINEDEIPF